jgi:hypothetical protein
VWACSMGGVVDWAADLRRRVRTIHVDGADCSKWRGNAVLNTLLRTEPKHPLDL